MFVKLSMMDGPETPINNWLTHNYVQVAVVEGIVLCAIAILLALAYCSDLSCAADLAISGYSLLGVVILAELLFKVIHTFQ